MQAIECITSPDNQGVNAELTGNMPASAAGYEYPALAEIYPPAAARPVPGEPRRGGAAHGHAVLERHLRRAPELLAPDATPSTAQTPPDSQQFIEDVLHGRSLL